MTYKEVKKMLDTVGIPTAYYQFPDKTGQNPPFICFFYPDNIDFIADDKNYQKIVRLVIELYTENKDFDLEESVESALSQKDLVYTRAEEKLDDERMYLVVFETNVVITEEINNGQQD